MNFEQSVAVIMAKYEIKRALMYADRPEKIKEILAKALAELEKIQL